MSFLGPLPDIPKTYVDATLGHLESALSFGRLLAEKVVALEQENERLRQWVVEYGRHAEGCSAAHGDQYRCRCGWDEVERRLTKELGDE